ENGRLCSFEYQYPFSKSIETGVEADGCLLNCTTRCEYINCRAVTSRKIDLHGAAAISIKIIKRKSTEIISDIDDKNIELLRGTAPATTPMGFNEKYLIIEEKIELTQSQSNMCSVIRYDAVPIVKECKILSGKVVIKGEISFSILCSGIDCPPQTVRSIIPFSQILEIEGITDSCECDTSAQIVYLEIKPQLDANGEAKALTVNAKILVGCECYCNNDIDVVLDAFSRKFHAEIIKNDVCINKICRKINERFNCKKNLEFSDGSLSAVADMWCNVKVENIKLDTKCLEINGTVIASIIAIDTEGLPSFYEKMIDFEYSCPIDLPNTNLRCDPIITVSSANYTITGSGNMEFRVELCVNAVIYEDIVIPLISDVEINEKRPIESKSHSAMTIYFATSGESVWEIARKYCASIKEIKQINDLNDETLENDTMILVPMN
ncbi:MAG: DUF3794 domain-containing protein, partial [Clostridia bacterium]|nr:DUF3794 domain-containing protein [Clostridia bacterium]